MSTVPARTPVLSRDPAAGVVAGVCAGLGRRLGVDPLLLRVCVIAASAAGGVGVILYGLGWLLLPVAAAGQPVRRRRRGTTLASLQVGTGVCLLLASLLLTLRQLGLWAGDPVVFPVVLAAGGLAIVWRQITQPLEAEVGAPAGSARAASTRPSAGPEPVVVSDQDRRTERVAGVYRGGFGVALIVGAGLLVLQAAGALSAARDVVLSAVVVVAALALILAPFLYRFARTLTAERAARIRSQERAELAAHLHDSVLQTLALVQQQSADPRAVATLARRQERELRTWLDGEDGEDGRSGAGGAGGGAPAGRFAAALRTAAADVEEQYAVPVDIVAVGDAALDEGLHAIVAAAREAMVNAAKFGAGGDGPAVAVYAEIGSDRVEVFVRDRGPGFDVEAIPPDRRGVRESIVGRMERCGGRAEIHAVPGSGVEVQLRLEHRP